MSGASGAGVTGSGPFTLDSSVKIQNGSADGLDVTGVIRSPEVGQAVSVVAANADVRAALVSRPRRSLDIFSLRKDRLWRSLNSVRKCPAKARL